MSAPADIIIPPSFPVEPIDPDDSTAVAPCTCGTCGLTWDDAVVTSWTPVPVGRCPFEYFHNYEPLVWDHVHGCEIA